MEESLIVLFLSSFVLFSLALNSGPFSSLR